MRRPASFDLLRVSLLTALGLLPTACGAKFEAAPEDGGAGTGGASGNGGNGAVAGNGGNGAVAGNGGNGAVAGNGGTGAVLGCVDPQPVLQRNGKPSGVVKCADGSLDRVGGAECITEVAKCQGDELSKLCTSDAECTQAPNGRCGRTTGVDTPPTCGCVYPCRSDADCGVGAACVCAGAPESRFGVASCVPAPCRTGNDCASGECGIVAYDDGCGLVPMLACRTQEDACRATGECPPGPDGSRAPTCVAANGASTWTCTSNFGCAIGRPLMIDGTARVAATSAKHDWSGALALEVEALAPSLREAIASHWSAVAALEHASVASFARFTLELMSFGAPPELIGASQRASLDEIEHARATYALASRYAGRPLGPSALPLAGLELAATREALLRALVHEACVGETLGAAEAREIAAAVADPTLRAVLERIADDEAEHGALGWRALAWLLGEDPSLQVAALDAFEHAQRAYSIDPPSGVHAPEHGLPSGATLGALRRRAIADVVEPCLRALLGQDAA